MSAIKNLTGRRSRYSLITLAVSMALRELLNADIPEEEIGGLVDLALVAIQGVSAFATALFGLLKVERIDAASNDKLDIGR